MDFYSSHISLFLYTWFERLIPQNFALLPTNSRKKYIKRVDDGGSSMIDRDEYNACMSFARQKGLAEGEAKVKERYAARYKKIAEYLRSHGVPEKLLKAAFAIK